MPDPGAWRIEPWGADDLPLLEQLVGDPAMMEHLGGRESPERIVERHARYQRITGREGRMYTIVEVATGTKVGSVGYWARTWCSFEYPPGHPLVCNDWRLDLRAAG